MKNEIDKRENIVSSKSAVWKTGNLHVKELNDNII